MTIASRRPANAAIALGTLVVSITAGCRNTNSRTCAEGLCFELNGDVRATSEGHKRSYHIAAQTGWLDIQSFEVTPPTRETIDEGASLLLRRYELLEATNVHSSRTTIAGLPSAVVDADRLWHGVAYRRRTWLLLVDHRWVAMDVTAPQAHFDSALALFRPTIGSVSVPGIGL